eukprot:1158274-Pelagomonas_calceolata.AAC.3
MEAHPEQGQSSKKAGAKGSMQQGPAKEGGAKGEAEAVGETGAAGGRASEGDAPKRQMRTK